VTDAIEQLKEKIENKMGFKTHLGLQEILVVAP
jgi:hypothetical protein